MSARPARLSNDAASPPQRIEPMTQPSATGAHAEEPDRAAPMPLPYRPFSEISGTTWKVVVASWAAFFAVLALTFIGKTDMGLVLLVIAFFGAMFFAVPMVLLRINKKTDPSQDKPYLETLDGRLSRSEALAQIIVVPVILTIGLIFIGYFATHSG